MKKRILPLFLAALLLAGCVQKAAPSEVTASADEIAQAVLNSQADREGVNALSGGELAFYLTNLYGLEEGDWTDAAIYAAGGMDAREITVILPAEGREETVAAALENYRQSRLGDFFGYAPAQAALVEDAHVVGRTGCRALLICADMDSALAAFGAFHQGETSPTVAADPTAAPSAAPNDTQAPSPTPDQTAEPSAAPENTPPSTGTPEPPVTTPDPTPGPAATPTPAPTPSVLNPDLDISGFIPFDPPNEFDMTLYDTAPILAAWKSGDDSGLSKKDAAILERCREICAEVITDGMTDLEKELALHNYLTAWGSYDSQAHRWLTPLGRADNTNPYGMLVKGYGVCLGYATSFQLLMDLAGIECITVIGAAYGSSEDHAWNMVRLDGEWYCVDVTWDDPSGGNPSHAYFNVSSEIMRLTNHQWDYQNVPETSW